MYKLPTTPEEFTMWTLEQADKEQPFYENYEHISVAEILDWLKELLKDTPSYVRITVESRLHWGKLIRIIEVNNVSVIRCTEEFWEDLANGI